MRSSDVINMVSGQDRKSELGYQLAKDLIYNFSNNVKFRAQRWHWHLKEKGIPQIEDPQRKYKRK